MRTHLKTLFIALITFFIIDATQAQTIEKYWEQRKAFDKQYRENYNNQHYDLALKALENSILLIDTTSGISLEERETYKEVFEKEKCNYYYNMACCYALTHQKRLALKNLRIAIDYGYTNYRNMLDDSDLDFIRKEKDFIALLKRIEQYKPLTVLKNANSYQKENTDSLPSFSYQAADDRNLMAVRSFFNLDSVAGDGDELSKIIRILNFAHNSIRHDGGNYALSEFDAIDLYNYHKSTGKGINCRHLAIALSEMYLSMGIPARYVTCMPKDSRDQDCHVINCVWSSQLEKWIWIDPTFNAYVKDENGVFLSIAEVRERLIDGRPLVLNEDANWNNENKQTKEDYLETYMAKNLYWLSCATEYCFNPESRYRYTGNKYVVLIPIGFEVFGHTDYITTDAEYFWQAPEK